MMWLMTITVVMVVALQMSEGATVSKTRHRRQLGSCNSSGGCGLKKDGPMEGNAALKYSDSENYYTGTIETKTAVVPTSIAFGTPRPRPYTEYSRMGSNNHASLEHIPTQRRENSISIDYTFPPKSHSINNNNKFASLFGIPTYKQTNNTKTDLNKHIDTPSEHATSKKQEYTQTPSESTSKKHEDTQTPSESTENDHEHLTNMTIAKEEDYPQTSGDLSDPVSIVTEGLGSKRSRSPPISPRMGVERRQLSSDVPCSGYDPSCFEGKLKNRADLSQLLHWLKALCNTTFCFPSAGHSQPSTGHTRPPAGHSSLSIPGHPYPQPIPDQTHPSPIPDTYPQNIPDYPYRPPNPDYAYPPPIPSQSHSHPFDSPNNHPPPTSAHSHSTPTSLFSNPNSLVSFPLTPPSRLLASPLPCNVFSPPNALRDRKIVLQDGDQDSYVLTSEKFPSFAAVLREDFSSDGWISRTFLCGGSLIHESIVLTAAHCITTTTTTTLKVLLGPWNTQAQGTTTPPPPQQERNITVIVRHPHYNTKTLTNDLALIYLNAPAILTPNVLPICLGCVVGSAWCVAVKWEDGNKVNKINVPVWDQDNCEAHLNTIKVDRERLNHPSLLCTSSEMFYRSGGSPLQCWDPYSGVYVLVGVMAYHIPFVTSVTGVYINVSQEYNWIVDTAQCMLKSLPTGGSGC